MCVCVFVRGISHAIVGFTMRFHRIEVAMRAKSNRLLLSVATMHVHPACCSKRDFFIFSIAGVFVYVCVSVGHVVVFRSRDELARNREYDGDDDYYCCCCGGC